MGHRFICDWLGLSDEAWPPDHYRLLGLPLGEGDAARIEQQVHDRLDVVRRYQLLHPEAVTEAMNRLAQAFVCLTDPEAKKAYDTQLQKRTPETSAVDEVIAEAVNAGTPEPLAFLYRQDPQKADFARAVTQLDTPSVGAAQPPADAKVRGVDAAPPVRRPASPNEAIAEARPWPDQPEPIEDEAHASAPARRGLGSKRALYHRIAQTRQILRVWHEAGQFIGHPGRRLAKPIEATDLIHGLITLRTELKSFPPLLGEAGQPGYLVVALARQQVIVPTFQTLLPSQRDALARDWRAGLKVLDAHLLFLRQELRTMRRRGPVALAAHAMKSMVQKHLGLLLILIMTLATIIALGRTVGAEWIGEYLDSGNESPSTESAGAVARKDGPPPPPRRGGTTEPRKVEDPPPPPENHDFVGPPFPPEFDPPTTAEKKEASVIRFETKDIHCIRSIAALSGKRFFSCDGNNKRLLRWDAALESPEVVAMADVPVSLAYCPKTGRVACGDEAGNVFVFKDDGLNSTIRNGRLVKSFDKPISALAFSGDGNWLLSGHEDGKAGAVLLWDISGSAPSHRLGDPKRPVRAVALSTKGDRAYWGGEDAEMHAWDVPNAQAIELAGGPKDAITALALSPDGNSLFCTCRDPSLWRWDLMDEKGAPKRERLVSDAMCLAVSPDGRFLISGDDGKLHVWDATTLKHIHSIEDKSGLVCSLAYSPDGKYILSGHAGGVMILWPASTVEKRPSSSEK